MRDPEPRARGLTVVYFAVSEEAQPFRRRLAEELPQVQVLLTGMGRRNAEQALRGALAAATPDLVVTSGFAGGLKAGLESGTVVFDADEAAGLRPALLAAGAIPVRFHCAETVAVTAADKRRLQEQTGADAVEMESGIIRAVCAQCAIPSATVRVILDTAREDLALDFNALMTEEMRLSAGRLALALAKAPGKIPALLRLQKQSAVAARSLARVLAEVLVGGR